MEIKIHKLTKDGLKENDYRDCLIIMINDETVLNFYDGEPEDNNIARNFNDVHKIHKLLYSAWEAGRKGEELSWDTEEHDDIEDIQ